MHDKDWVNPHQDSAELAKEMHDRSLLLSTTLLAVFFGIGALVGIPQLISGQDPPAFIVPALVCVTSVTTGWLTRTGRGRLARGIFAGILVSYCTSLMFFAAGGLRLSLGFPLASLAVLLSHLIYAHPNATRLGYLIVTPVVLGFAQLVLTVPEVRADTGVLISIVAQVLMLTFANFVLGRLGGGWTRAMRDAQIARQELADAYERVQEASQAKSRFLASMSHELRTPLNAVIGYAELADDDLADTGTVNSEDLHRIQRSGRHLLSLVNQVLDLSRVESGRVDLVEGDVDLAAVLREVGDTLMPNGRAGRATLRVELQDEPVLRLDRLRTLQIVTNLVSNAIKFTPDGDIELLLRSDPDHIIVSVRDTGPGIPPHRLEAIFAPFEQADATVQTSHGGTGLGLAISRSLARQMGGDVCVRSELGHGSEFQLVFPRTLCNAA